MTRAFTLLESLLAAALLSALAVACAGILSAAPVRAVEPGFTIDELGDLADRAMRSPAALGLAGLTPAGLPPWASIPWPDDQGREPVAVEIVRADTHAWVCFACRGLHVVRWVRTSEEEP